MASAVQSLKVADLILDPRLQSRTELDQATVREYAEVMALGDLGDEASKFPPLQVFEVEQKLYVTDGFHRAEAAKIARILLFPSKVQPNATWEEAVIAAAGSNARHGLKRKNEDKHRSVNMILATEDGAKWSNGEIARWCCVSDDLVAKLRRSTLVNESSTQRIGRDGKVRDVSNIGRKAAAEVPDYRLSESYVEAQSKSKERVAETDIATEAPSKPAGKSIVNGKVQDDPADVAAMREAGKIGPDTIPEVTDPAELTAVADVAEEYEESESKASEIPDSEWLPSLPLHSKLTGNSLRIFERDAILFRRTEAYLRTYKAQVAPKLKEHRRNRATEGAYAYRMSGFLKIDHPRHWVACPPADSGGCGGTGQVMLIGECVKCHGRGYRINGHSS